jgi:hypothetical protein
MTGTVFYLAALGCSHGDQVLDPTEATRLRCAVCNLPFCSCECLRAHEQRVAQDVVHEELR